MAANLGQVSERDSNDEGGFHPFAQCDDESLQHTFVRISYLQTICNYTETKKTAKPSAFVYGINFKVPWNPASNKTACCKPSCNWRRASKWLLRDFQNEPLHTCPDRPRNGCAQARMGMAVLAAKRSHVFPELLLEPPGGGVFSAGTAHSGVFGNGFGRGAYSGSGAQR